MVWSRRNWCCFVFLLFLQTFPPPAPRLFTVVFFFSNCAITSPRNIPLFYIWSFPENNNRSRLLLFVPLDLSPFHVAGAVNFFQVTGFIQSVGTKRWAFLEGLIFVCGCLSPPTPLLFFPKSLNPLFPLLSVPMSLQSQQGICWDLTFISLFTYNFKFVVFFW